MYIIEKSYWFLFLENHEKILINHAARREVAEKVRECSIAHTSCDIIPVSVSFWKILVNEETIESRR